jgi:hypothetical protein
MGVSPMFEDESHGRDAHAAAEKLNTDAGAHPRCRNQELT